MNTKYLFTAIAVVVVLVIGLFIYNQKNQKDQFAGETNTSNTNSELNLNSNTSTNSNENMNANVSVNANLNTTIKEPPIPDGNDVAVFQVTYNGTNFSPASLTIKSGDVVIFKNTSTESVWPASDPHPSHTNYPGFDSKQAVAPGGTYQFKFTKVGSWGYHNHLNPSQKGTIIVK